MNLTIDCKENESTYVDKANLHIANKDEIIKLISYDNLDTYINIIAGSYKLNDVEIETLKYLFKERNSLYKETCRKVSYITNKSIITITRALNELRNKNIIYYDNDKICISNSIDISEDKINKSKFIVIELINN